MGGGEVFFFFLTPLLSNRMLYHHPLIQWAVFVSLSQLLFVENNIVKGNQPSVSVLVWGGKN